MVKENKNIPELVWILSVLYLFGAGVFAVLGFFLFSFYDTFRSMGGYPIVDPATNQVLTYISSGSFLGIGFLMIALAVLFYYLARGLLKSQNWSRIVTSVIYASGLIYSIISLKGAMYLTGLLGILINGTILWYFLKGNSIKKYFK